MKRFAHTLGSQYNPPPRFPLGSPWGLRVRYHKPKNFPILVAYPRLNPDLCYCPRMHGKDFSVLVDGRFDSILLRLHENLLLFRVVGQMVIGRLEPLIEVASVLNERC